MIEKKDSVKEIFSAEKMQDNIKIEKPVVRVYTRSKDKKEKSRLISIINKACENPDTKALMELVSKKHYMIMFDDFAGKSGGFFVPRGRKILLNRACNDDRLTCVLAHEARHLWQFTKNIKTSAFHDNIKTQTIINRAMEADAQVAAVSTGWWLKEKGDEKPFEEFRKITPWIANAFEKEIEKSKDINKAKTSAFNAWYEVDTTKRGYEKFYILGRLGEIESKNNLLKTTFEKAKKSEDIISELCENSDGNSYYMDNPKKLEKGHFLDIDKETHDFLNEVFEKREKQFGLKPDNTLKEFVIRANKKDKTSKNQNISLIMSANKKIRE